MEPKAAAKPASVKIVNQYFRGEVRVCELESPAGTIDVHVSRSGEADWVVEVHSTRAADAVVIVGSGATSAAALTAAVTSWGAQADYLGLKTFDWKSVSEALHTVRAIE